MSNNLKVFPALTVGTAAVPVISDGLQTHMWASVSVQADPANSGVVYVGNSLLTPTQYARALNPGDWFTLSGSAVDAAKVYVLGSAAGQVVHVSGS